MMPGWAGWGLRLRGLMIGVVAPYALSVHSFVAKVGNYAGFAAIIGVALLVIMFFVNARETSALRDRAEAAEDRLHRLEYHAERVGRAAATAAAQPTQATPPPATAPPPAAPPAGAPVVSAPAVGRATARPPADVAPASSAAAASAPVAPPAGASPASAAPVAVPAAPAAPAGVGAPALSAATRLIPAADPDAIAIRRAAAVSAAPAVAVMEPPSAPSPPPSTAAAGAVPGVNGASGGRVPPSAPAPGGMGSFAPRRDYGRGSGFGGSRVGRGSIAVATVLVAVIVVAVVLVITHGGGGSGSKGANAASTNHGAKSSNAPASKRTTQRVTVNKANVMVAVLNGTSTAHLAHDVSAKLSQAGYRQGGTGNAADQTLTTTIVGYLPGRRDQALAVAHSLSLGTGSVRAVNSSDRQVACAATPTACPDQVVVTVGSDLNSAA